LASQIFSPSKTSIQIEFPTVAIPAPVDDDDASVKYLGLNTPFLRPRAGSVKKVERSGLQLTRSLGKLLGGWVAGPQIRWRDCLFFRGRGVGEKSTKIDCR